MKLNDSQLILNLNWILSEFKFELNEFDIKLKKIKDECQFNRINLTEWPLEKFNSKI